MEHVSEILFNFDSSLSFDVEDFRDHSWKGKWQGYGRPSIRIDFLNVEGLL